MKTTEQFLTAKNDKKLTAMLIIDRMEYTDINRTAEKRRKYIRLCLDVKLPYSNNSEMVFVESDTEIYYEDYSGKSAIKNSEINNTLKTCFHCSVYRHASHITTFLKTISKNSDVKFKVITYNNNQFYNDNNLVCHQLYGIIDDKKSFLLESYVGRENLASPITL